LTAHSWPTALPEPPLVRPASGGDNRAERGRQGNRNEVKGGSTSPTAAAVGTLAGTHIGTYATGGLGVHGLRCISVKSPGASRSRWLLTPSLALGCRRWHTDSLDGGLMTPRQSWRLLKISYRLTDRGGRVLHLEVWQ
jgi:hypothetical protein